MTDVRVRLSTGEEILVDSRIQKNFPHDFELVEGNSSADEPPEAATAVNQTTGGEPEGDQG